MPWLLGLILNSFFANNYWTPIGVHFRVSSPIKATYHNISMGYAIRAYRIRRLLAPLTVWPSIAGPNELSGMQGYAITSEKNKTPSTCFPGDWGYRAKHSRLLPFSVYLSYRAIPKPLKTVNPDFHRVTVPLTFCDHFNRGIFLGGCGPAAVFKCRSLLVPRRDDLDKGHYMTLDKGPGKARHKGSSGFHGIEWLKIMREAARVPPDRRIKQAMPPG